MIYRRWLKDTGNIGLNRSARSTAYLLLELLTSFHKSLEEADEVLARCLATAILICSFIFFAKRSAASVFPLLDNLVRRWRNEISKHNTTTETI